MTSHRAATQRGPWLRRWLIGCVLLIAVGLIAFGSLAMWDRHEVTHRSPDAPVSSGELNETPVKIDSCSAAHDEPKLISLGSLDVEGCIEKVGTTEGQLDAPENIHVAGWYDKSALPGDDGLAIIDGHSSGRYKDGIFNQIGSFEDGSIFTIEYGDGSLRRFEVTSVATHQVTDTMTKMASDALEQSANIALITCGGEYDSADHSFDRRVVVLATNA